MKHLLTILALVAFVSNVLAQKTITLSLERSGADEIITNYWNNSTAPHSNEETEDERINERLHIYHTSQTDFYIYKADPAKANGLGVVITPGGGYRKVCIAHDGFAMAQYLRSLGVSSIVVKYRLPNGHSIIPLEDTQEAMRYMRKRGPEWGVDPTKVGICGSSAGGHLAAYASTFTPDEEKPVFSILVYPVITGAEQSSIINTFKELVGEQDFETKQRELWLEKHVTPTTPPALLLLSDDDPLVPSTSSVRYYEALKANDVAATMFILPSGGHSWCGHDEFKYSNLCKAAIADWLQIQEERLNKK